MRRKNHSLTFVFMALLMMLMTFASCSKIQDLLNEGDDDDDDDGGINPPELVEGRMEDIALSGIVRDASGTPIEGVSIVSGSSAATTNTDGFFEFDQIQVVSVQNDRSVVRFSKAGYFDVVRSMDADDDAADGASWEVVMCRKENNDFTSIKTYSSSSDQTLQAGEMKIDMPQDGYKVDGTGVGYTGKVKSEMVYLDPNNERFSEMMPGGDLAAVRSDNSSAQLVSYGMTDLNMYAENGDKLQLKEGNKAKLTFPIPAGMGENPPASIPLWSFNEKTGLWEEEGSAALQGNVYVGEVAHFSWVNLDYPEKQGTVYGYVKDDTGKVLPGVRLSIGQLLASTVSKSDGYYSHEVPANTDFSITVYYNGGSSDYQKLKNAAAKLGLTNMGEDNEDGYMAVNFYSAKKKMLITLEYDPHATGATDKNTFEDIDEYAPIYMMVLDGVTEEALRAMMEDDDDDTRSTRVTARKHLNPISKCKFDGFKKKKMFKKLARLR